MSSEKERINRNRKSGKSAKMNKSSKDDKTNKRRRSDMDYSVSSEFDENTESVYDRFLNFSEHTEESSYEDDYFGSRYGYTSTSKKKEERTEKPKKEFSRKKERSYSVNIPQPKELTRKQRKLRTRIIYIVTFLVIVLAAVLLSFTVMFRTNEIVVENSESVPYSDSEIIAKSGLKPGGNIFTAQKKAAVRNIVDNFPYIENAEITFRIPGTQVIKIEAAIPSYEVAVNGGFAIISEKGRVLEINPNQMSNIPLMKGLKVTDTQVGQYISFEKESTQQILNEVISSINENNVPLIYGIDISNSASIKLNYDNRITILIGLPEDVGYKLRTAMAIINNQLSATDKGDLDVSISNGNRKASYFTPITVSTESGVAPIADSSSKSESSAEQKSDYQDTPSSTIRKATSSAADEEGQNDIQDDDGYDYYYDDNYYDAEIQDDQDIAQNIDGEYGTNYYY